MLVSSNYQSWVFWFPCSLQDFNPDRLNERLHYNTYISIFFIASSSPMSAKLAADEICSLKCLVYFTLPRCQLQHIPKWEKMLHRPAASSCIVHRPPPLKKDSIKNLRNTRALPFHHNQSRWIWPIMKHWEIQLRNWAVARRKTGGARVDKLVAHLNLL